MAKLGINTGTAPNDNTGDSLILGAIKINSNFNEIYNYLGDGTTLLNATWNKTSSGINTLSNVGVGTTNPTSKLTVSGDVSVSGVITASSFSGNATSSTYATSAGIATNVIGGIASVTALNVSGVSTLGNTVVGGATTQLIVNGDVRITGILTIGTSSITLDGSNNVVNVGSGITINGSTGTINASSINLGGTVLTGVGVTYITAGSGISVDQNTGNVTITATGGGGSSQWVTTGAGIHTLSNVGIGTTNPTSKLTVQGNGGFSGLVTATSFSGTNLNVSGVSTFTDTRLNSVSEKSTVVSGNTVSLVYNTGGGNIAICTNPTGPITLDITGIPTDSTFDNRVLSFTVVAIQTATGYACTSVTLNGVTKTIKYPGGVISVGSTSSYDIFNFTGINTVGSGSTTANYEILGLVNGNFK